MKEQQSKETQKSNPWFQRRTIEDETGRDILSAIFFKYFVVLIGAIFAILLAKPEAASGTFWFVNLSFRYVIYHYCVIGFFGLMVYESFVMSAKKQQSQLKIPVYGIVLFGLYATVGVFIFIKLFGNLLGVDEHTTAFVNFAIATNAPAKP